MRSKFIILLLSLGGVFLAISIGIRFNRVPESTASEASKDVRIEAPLGSHQAPRAEGISEAKAVSIHTQQPLFRHPPVIPDSMAVLFGQNGEGLIARQVYLKELNDLSDLDTQAMLFFLQTTPEEGKLPADELNAIKNETVNVLKRRMDDPALLIRQLISLYSGTPDAVWRDYCVQHLGTLVGRAERTDRDNILAVLWDAVEQKSGCLAGTALIALTNNRDDAGVGRDLVADKALAIAQDEMYGEGSRITALQICAKLGDKRALLSAREIAGSSAAVPLRVSAIAAIGMLGEQGDSVLLSDYSKSSDVRLRKAVETAISRLSSQ